MEIPNFILREEENEKILFVLSSLVSKCRADGVYLINRNGQMITSSGQSPIRDEQSLASLSAGSVAATHGLARILGETEFTSVSHQGEKWNIHITSVGNRAILVVLADRAKSSIDDSSVKRARLILEDILRKNWQANAGVSAET